MRTTYLQKQAARNLAQQAVKGKRISISSAMVEAGYAPSTANGKAGKLLRDPGFQAELARYGLTEDRWYKKLDRALEATKWNDFTGEREPDYKTQLPYHTKLGKLLGVEREESPQLTLNYLQYVQQMRGELGEADGPACLPNGQINDDGPISG